MCTKMHDYFKSDTYYRKMCKAYNVTSVTSVQNKICTKMYFGLLAKTIQSEKEHLQSFTTYDAGNHTENLEDHE